MRRAFRRDSWLAKTASVLFSVILSLGGGGMNKVNFPDGSLQRFHNPKFPEQYIQQIQDVLRQKEELFSLL